MGDDFKTRIAESNSATLGTSYTAVTLESASDDCRLSMLHAELTSVVSATTVTWYLAADSDGDVPLTDAVTSTILAGATTATSGGVSSLVNMDYLRASNGTTGKLYAFTKLDAGSATATVRLYWRE